MYRGRASLSVGCFGAPCGRLTLDPFSTRTAHAAGLTEPSQLLVSGHPGSEQYVCDPADLVILEPVSQ